MILKKAGALRNRAYLSGVAIAIGVGVSSVTLAASETPLEEVVVTGFRQSLEQSLDLKRETTGMVDAIFAEDIADFPDLNLAESIQRIPGVAIDRVGGEGRQITIRGLSPEFSRVRINGMEALTTTSATDAFGTNRGRAFDFNVFASELFNQISVRKTSSAEVDEGSLGATIDLNTARPLDSAGFKFVTSYQQGYNDLADELDPRAVALVSMTNDAQTFGALFSVAYSKRSTLEEGGQSGGWEVNSNTATDRWDECPACNNDAARRAAVDNAVHARFPRYASFEHDQERLGLTGSLQWRPADSTLLSFDVLHSKLDAERTEPFLEAISFARGNAAGRRATDVLDYEIDSNNTMVYGVFNDVDVRSENRLDVWNTEFNQYSLSLNQEFSDRFRVDALVGTSKSELEVEHATTIILENFDSDNYVYDFRGNSQAPYISYGFDVTNPANWVVSEVRERPSVQSNEFDTARLDGAFDLNEVFTLKGGVSWKEYGFDVNAAQRDRTLPINTAGCTLPQTALNGSQGHLTSFGQDTSIPAGVQRSFFVADIRAVADLLGLYSNDSCFPLVQSAADTRSVTEEDLGYHVQVDFRTEMFGLPFSGDVGVRYVETDMTSTGVQVVAGANVPVTVERTYSDTLPAVNLVLEARSDLLLRAAYSKVMSRPPLAALSPGGSIGGFAVPPTVTFGNPDLDPFRADAYDLSVEWYFAEEALIALALFRKDIESFTVNSRESLPWSALGLPDSLLDQVPAGPGDTFDVRTTVNGTGGKVEGYEIQYQQPFSFLPGPDWVRNFGTILNYTNVESKVNYGTDAQPNIRNLNGLSEQSANATLYFDNDRFSARVSLAYRDSFQRNATSRAGNDIDYTDESTYVDFSTSYRISDHFKVSLEALNLTDEYRLDLMDTTAGRLENNLHSGTQYYVGLQYSY